MNYYDSAENINITFSRAVIECRRHGMTRLEAESFIIFELNREVTYNAQKVLELLGY